MRDDRAQDHGRAENHQNRAVPPRLVVPGRRRPEFVIRREDLYQDTPQFSRGRADAVTRSAISCGK